MFTYRLILSCRPNIIIILSFTDWDYAMLEKAHERITVQKILTKLWQIYRKVSHNYHSVSRKHEIPRRTLQRQMKGTVREPGCAKLGRFRTILYEEMETEIFHHAIDTQQRFYGLTPCDS